MSKKRPRSSLGPKPERVVFHVPFVGNFWMNFIPRTVPSAETSDWPSAPPLSSHAPNRAEAFLTCGSKIVQVSLLDSPNG